MRLKTLALAAGAAALTVTPAVIQARAADRAVAPVTGEQELGGGSDVIYAVIAVAILGAFIALTASDDDVEPLSP
ncbi:hypothetical protein [Altererythrobacter sp.]|uniref:hypothetical protein n=1 Tax=Altererythrobacter sp. TaxID=1872480 RepID=UPI003D08E301